MRRARLALAAALLAAPLAAFSATHEPGAVRDRLAAAAAPYLGKAQGWDLGGEVKARAGAGGATVLTVPALSYRGPDGASAAFGTTVLEIRPRDGAYAVVAKPARLRLADGRGRAADLDFADGVMEGVWDPAREAFRDLKLSLRDLRGGTGDGGRIVADALSAAFTGRPDAFAGEVVATALEVTAGDGRFSALDRAVLGLRLTSPERAPHLALTYRQERPPAAEGLQREFIPTLLTLQGGIADFPWREALRRLPGAAADLARGGAAEAAQALLRQAGATLTVDTLTARTPTLSASGQGEARFQGERPVGRLTLDISGLDDRLGSLPAAEQRRSPSLYPGLAVITLLGEAQGRGKGMARRYRLDLLPNGGIGLNGKDLSALGLAAP